MTRPPVVEGCTHGMRGASRCILYSSLCACVSNFFHLAFAFFPKNCFPGGIFGQHSAVRKLRGTILVVSCEAPGGRRSRRETAQNSPHSADTMYWSQYAIRGCRAIAIAPALGKQLGQTLQRSLPCRTERRIHYCYFEKYRPRRPRYKNVHQNVPQCEMILPMR